MDPFNPTTESPVSSDFEGSDGNDIFTQGRAATYPRLSLALIYLCRTD